MTRADLRRFFNPASVAVIGASPDTGKIRGVLLRNLRQNGYSGAIYPVNPSYPEIDGLRCYPAVAAIGEPIDLALIAIPAPGVPAAVEECAAAGVRHAVIISSGFAEEGGARGRLQDQIGEIARRTGIRVSGPNAEGFLNEIAQVAATFSPAVEQRDRGGLEVAARRIAIVAQSGGIGFALYDRGRALGLPFSFVVTTGNEVDLTAADFFAHAVEDDATGVILLFLESVRDAAGFAAAARRAQELGKPVIAVKVGRSRSGERATVGHTASMAGWNTAYRAFFQRYGIVEAFDPDEAIAATAALATLPRARGDRAAIITVSGGAGAWSADMIEAAGLTVPELSDALRAPIAAGIPSYGSTANPVDVTAQGAFTGGLIGTLRRLRDADEIDLIVVALSMASDRRITLSAENLKGLLGARTKPIVFYSYTLPSAFARQSFAEGGAVVFTGLRELGIAARALTQAPPTLRETAVTRQPPPPAFADRHGTLAEWQGKRFLAMVGVPVPDEVLVRNETDIAAAVVRLGLPLAMKIQSQQLPHKTESGGVALGLDDIAAIVAARRAMLERVAGERPDAEIDGVLLAPMAKPGVEMIVATLTDPVFGPMIMVGAGGVATELYRDAAYRLAPVDSEEVRAMLRELKSWPLLDRFRGRPKADVAALIELMVRLSHIAASYGAAVREIELNPVRVHDEGHGITILDALVTLA